MFNTHQDATERYREIQSKEDGAAICCNMRWLRWLKNIEHAQVLTCSDFEAPWICIGPRFCDSTESMDEAPWGTASSATSTERLHGSSFVKVQRARIGARWSKANSCFRLFSLFSFTKLDPLKHVPSETGDDWGVDMAHTSRCASLCAVSTEVICCALFRGIEMTKVFKLQKVLLLRWYDRLLQYLEPCHCSMTEEPCI